MAKKTVQDTRNLFKRGAIWYVHRMDGGKRLIQSTGETTLKAALIERNRILNPFNLQDQRERAEAVLSRIDGIDKKIAKIKEESPALSLRDAWTAYLDQPNRPDTGPATLNVYRQQFETFCKWVEANHKDSVEMRHIGQSHADAYSSYLLKKVSASTFNRHMNLLALVWRVLFKTAHLNVNPWSAEHITRKKFVVHSRRELTIDEINRAMNTANGEMRLLLAFGIYCGLRLGDAATIQWANVDMVKRIITLIPHKTERSQKRIILPIHPTLYSLLEETPTSMRKGLIIPMLAERYRSYDGALAKDVIRLFQRCNIIAASEKPKSDKNREKRRKVADCGYHSLRHTFVSLCVAGGVSQSVVQNLVGHGSPVMTAHYTHIALDTAREAIGVIPSVGGHGSEDDGKCNGKSQIELCEIRRILAHMTPAQLDDTLKIVREEQKKRSSSSNF